MTIDERIEALTMNLELAGRDIQDLRAAQQETLRTFGIVLDSIKSLENIARARTAS